MQLNVSHFLELRFWQLPRKNIKYSPASPDIFPFLQLFRVFRLFGESFHFGSLSSLQHISECVQVREDDERGRQPRSKIWTVSSIQDTKKKHFQFLKKIPQVCLVFIFSGFTI